MDKLHVFAFHMKHKTTGERRIKKIKAHDSTSAHCNDVGYEKDWVWVATEPFKNVSNEVIHIGGGYYKFATITEKEIVRATAIYTGGGIYLYYAELSNGNWIHGDETGLAIFNSNPLTDEESGYSEWQEEHYVADIPENEYQVVLNLIISIIEKGKTIKEYDNFSLSELERRKKRRM